MSAESSNFWDALHEHEREDDKRHGEVMRELGTVSTKLDGMKDQLGRIDSRQWDEHPSRAHAPAPSSGKPPKPLDTRVMLAIIGALVVMSHVVDHLVTALVDSKPAQAAVTPH
jgi:hypothetical protein